MDWLCLAIGVLLFAVGLVVMNYGSPHAGYVLGGLLVMAVGCVLMVRFGPGAGHQVAVLWMMVGIVLGLVIFWVFDRWFGYLISAEMPCTCEPAETVEID